MKSLTIRLLADGASLEEMDEVRDRVVGYTTNPSLVRRAGVKDYHAFARQALEIARGKPISFEVLSDDFDEMARQARIMAKWAPNVFVKIPISNTRGESSCPLITQLAREGVKLNVTAIMHRLQVESAVMALDRHVPSFISIFAGRVADIGIDPVPFMYAMANFVHRSKSALIWASTRELFNIRQANDCEVGYITVSAELLRKLDLIGKDAFQHSLDTVKEFYRDAQSLTWDHAVGAV